MSDGDLCEVCGNYFKHNELLSSMECASICHSCLDKKYTPKEVTMNKDLKRVVLDTLESTLTIIPESEAWAIFYRGKQVQLMSGKSIWKTKGYAKSAFTTHMGNVNENFRHHFVNMSVRELKIAVRKVVDHLIDTGIIEFRQIGI